MSEISHADVLGVFVGWERKNKKIAVVGSNEGFTISLRNGNVTLCLDDMLQLSFREEGVLRLFLRGATFWQAEPKDFPAESRDWVVGFDTGIQIRFVNLDMQCFVFPSKENKPG
jgi:hypothetical protein